MLGAQASERSIHASSEYLAFGAWYTRTATLVAHTLQRNKPHGMPTMISLALLAALTAGVANIALVTLVANRLGPKADTAAAGEFAAVGGAAPASAKRAAVKIGNENVLPVGAQRAA
jgi:hypothetical protein